MHCSHDCHQKAIKRVLRYPYCTSSFGILVSSNLDNRLFAIYLFVRDQVHDNSIAAKHLHFADQIADILTKPRPRASFDHMINKLGVVDVTPNTQRCKRVYEELVLLCQLQPYLQHQFVYLFMLFVTFILHIFYESTMV